MGGFAGEWEGEGERGMRTSVSVVEYSYSHSDSESNSGGRERLGELGEVGMVVVRCWGKGVRVVASAGWLEDRLLCGMW